jgi:hypothetical protein
MRFLPVFMWDILRTRRQISKARGFQGGSLLADRQWAFWTMTAWDSQDSMRRYMTSGSHQKAMPHLLAWCDEASVVHWAQVVEALPNWGGRIAACARAAGRRRCKIRVRSTRR